MCSQIVGKKEYETNSRRRQLMAVRGLQKPRLAYLRTVPPHRGNRVCEVHEIRYHSGFAEAWGF
ncbi:MAG: hypothetical protein ACKESB_00130 [Candidatus Hodgkinia cicadicola]